MVGSGFQNIFKIPELKKRIFYTFMLLIVYRIGVHVPTPGIDSVALASFFAKAKGTIFVIFDMFAGGALERFSVFALGIMPYISIQLKAIILCHTYCTYANFLLCLVYKAVVAIKTCDELI